MKNTTNEICNFRVQKIGLTLSKNWLSFRFLKAFMFLLFVLISEFGFGQGATCAAATSIAVNGACLNGTIDNSSEDSPLIATSPCSGTFNREGWYTFTISTGPVDVLITGTITNTNRNLYLQLISSTASCAGLSVIACVNNTNSNSAQTESIVANLANGIYYIKVVNVGNNGSMNLSSLCVSTSLTVDITSGSSTVIPSGVCTIDVECWGAGGAGGRATSTNNNAGAGGGGGAYSKSTINVASGSSITYSLGIGGSGTTAGNSPGTDTWFVSSSTIMAKGGEGVADNNNTGGAGGLASVSAGDIKYNGGRGGNSANGSGVNFGGAGGGGAAGISGNGMNGGPGNTSASTAGTNGHRQGGSPGSGYPFTGGNTGVGGNGGAGNGNNQGSAGVSFGAGGGGGKRNNSGNNSGGNGSSGAIRITYHANPVTAPVDISSTSNAVCLGESTTLTADGGALGCNGASTLWFEGSCPTIGFVQEFQTLPYPIVSTTLNSVAGGILDVTSANTPVYPFSDAQINMENIFSSSIDTDVQRYIAIRYRVLSGVPNKIGIYFKKGSLALDESRAEKRDLIADSQWHIITIDMSVNSQWTNIGGNITGWRFDFTEGHAVRMQIDYIILASHPVLENTSVNEGVITVIPSATTTYYAARMEESAFYKVTPCTSTTIYIGKTWTGAVDGNWTTAGNWLPSGMPNSNHCVQSSSGTIIVNGNGNARNVTLTGTASLDIPSNHTLTVENIVDVSGTSGTFTIQDNGSLVQVNNTTNVGNIIAYRIAEPMKRYDFTYWSSPIEGQTLYDFSPYTLSDKYYSYDPISGWVIHYGGAATMEVGSGYAIRAPQSFPISTVSPTDFAGGFTGVPNNGDVTVSGFVGSATSEVWNLIGNPYPSAIDIELFLSDADNTEVGGTIYLWTHNTPPYNPSGSGASTYNSSDYASYNFSGGVAVASTATNVGTPEDPTDADDNMNAPTKYIASGQAFFIRGLKQFDDLTPVTSPVVKFKNSMRVASNNTHFFKPGPTTPIEDWETTGKHRFWLNLRNNEGAFNQTLIGYIENATDGLDRLYDGELFGGNFVTIYSLLDQNKLTIQGKALPFNAQDIVPLGYATTIEGDFTIGLDHFDGLFEGQDVFLKDKLLNTIHNLKEGAYSFNSIIGTFENRFEIVYQSETLSIENPEVSSESIIAYKDKNASIVVKSGLLLLDEVKIYDISGRLLHKSSTIHSAQVLIENLPQTKQVLIVDIRTTSGFQTAKKIVF